MVLAPLDARRGIEASQRLGRFRWVIERTLAWLVAQRCLQVRYERSSQLLHGLVHLACPLICLRRLRAATTRCPKPSKPRPS